MVDATKSLNGATSRLETQTKINKQVNKLLFEQTKEINTVKETSLLQREKLAENVEIISKKIALLDKALKKQTKVNLHLKEFDLKKFQKSGVFVVPTGTDYQTIEGLPDSQKMSYEKLQDSIMVQENTPLK